MANCLTLSLTACDNFDAIDNSTAGTMCKQVLKQTLKSPSSFHLIDQNIFSNDYIKIRFEAENSYGAKIANEAECTVDSDPGPIVEIGGEYLRRSDIDKYLDHNLSRRVELCSPKVDKSLVKSHEKIHENLDKIYPSHAGRICRGIINTKFPDIDKVKFGNQVVNYEDKISVSIILNKGENSSHQNYRCSTPKDMAITASISNNYYYGETEIKSLINERYWVEAGVAPEQDLTSSISAKMCKLVLDNIIATDSKSLIIYRSGISGVYLKVKEYLVNGDVKFHKIECNDGDLENPKIKIEDVEYNGLNQIRKIIPQDTLVELGLSLNKNLNAAAVANICRYGIERHLPQGSDWGVLSKTHGLSTDFYYIKYEVIKGGKISTSKARCWLNAEDYRFPRLRTY